MNSFFAELKQRRVYRVAVGYAIVAWLMVQIAATVLPAFHASDFILPLLIVLLGIGFPVALVLAWAFDVTPAGIKKTPEGTGATAAKNLRYGWALAGIGLLLAAAGVGGYWRWHFPQATHSITFEGAAPNAAREKETVAPEKSIAVLPFDNLSEEKGNAYFAEGIQDEILMRLAKVADLKVISRTSTQHFKSAPENLPQIAKQLGVTNILEGSVQKANDQVRVNVQLINATTDGHLWGETYDRKLTDIFAVESEIAKTIADTLQAKLTGSEKHLMAVQPTTDTDAYELYHQGRSLWQKRGDSIQKAIPFFEQAIARDPNYALAYAGLADAYVLLPAYTPASPRDAYPKAKAAALKALQLDPNLADAHSALGKLYLFADIDNQASIREFERAIELEPNDATARHWIASGPLSNLSRFDEALAHGKRAVELNPLSQIMNTDYGTIFYYAGRYDEAIALLRKALEFDPTFVYGNQVLGIAYQAKGDLPRAISQFEKATQLSEDPVMAAQLGAAKALSGDKNAAQKTLAELDHIVQRREVVAYARALLYLSLGNKPEAVHWLEQSFEDRDGVNIADINVDPLLLPLHGDPRFEVLVQKVLASKSQPKQED